MRVSVRSTPSLVWTFPDSIPFAADVCAIVEVREKGYCDGCAKNNPYYLGKLRLYVESSDSFRTSSSRATTDTANGPPGNHILVRRRPSEAYHERRRAANPSSVIVNPNSPTVSMTIFSATLLGDRFANRSVLFVYSRESCVREAPSQAPLNVIPAFFNEKKGCWSQSPNNTRRRHAYQKNV